jgi:type IV pilus assembly protein PilY1
LQAPITVTNIAGSNCKALYDAVIASINQGSATHKYIATPIGDLAKQWGENLMGISYQVFENVPISVARDNDPIIIGGRSGFEGGSSTKTRGDSHFFERVNIVPDKTYPKPATRTDCTSQKNACTYAEEMTNFGNWYAYYRTRLGVMKSSASMAFSAIDDSFRVGFTQINNLRRDTVYLPIRPFNPEQRSHWYARLFALNPGATEPTPLRGALAFAGRVYAGKEAVDDPVQYSCQKNFALLTTDGFWNVNEGGTGVLDIKGSIITDQDTDTTRPFYQGPTSGTVPSLADVAMYYYNTDLRAPEHGNCTSKLTNTNVCENNVPVTGENRNNAQHMVTFSLGLGVDGELRYQRDYKTATRGDFFNIKNGSADWPKPISSSSSAIDDLWHAAVNGRGQYFSAQDTATLVTSLREALAGIASEYGAGASAATSTAEPVSGDNFAYIATYTTGKWVGNLEARSIDVNNGNVGQQALWCAEDIPADPVRNLVACAGKMPDKVAATSDTRVIYFNDNNQLKNFDAATLGSTRLSLFDVTKLNQYSSWSADYKAQANATRMVGYLRGQTGFDMRDSNTFRLFREREATLGDFVGSAPRYVCKATSTFEDSGYEAFANGLKSGNNCTRTPMVYIGGNDGMLHAFDASTGEERWAFVPTPVIGQLWRLADNNYPINHRFFVDGAVTVEDVCIANCASVNAIWKTILVGALGGGVANGEDTDTAAPLSGYFALDITNPAVPILLWEITSASADVGDHIGYALGRPWIGKVKDAKGDASWSVLISSGVNPSGGGAALLVLNAYTGTVTRIISMDGGTGFTRFSPQVVKGGVDHTVTRIYGGDLAGNLWRIDPNKDGAAVKLMSSPGQPFTTEPELTLCNEKTSVFIGSGKFIENSDMDDKTQQTFYSLVDDYEKNGTLSSPRSTLQALTVKSGKISATSTSGNGLGWYLNLPDIPVVGGAERVALVDPALEGNVLTFATNVPESGICLASGKGKLYQIPIRTCGMSDMNPQVAVGTVTSLGNKLVVGMQRIKLPSGEIKLLVTGSDGTLTTSSSGQQISPPFAARRVGWRELIRD